MRAYRMLAPGVARLVEVPVPDPGPGQVRVDVVAAGLCHSDLHVIDGGVAASWRLPFTLGHEVCGTVAELGTGVTTCAVGDQVVVHAPWGCSTCARCVAGEPNYCDRRAALPAAGIGLGVDGGMADALVVDATRLVPVPGIDAATAAVLADAALTSFHALSGVRDLLVPPAGSPPHISTAQQPGGRTGEPPEYVQYEGRLAGTPSGNLDPPIYAPDFRRGTLSLFQPGSWDIPSRVRSSRMSGADVRWSTAENNIPGQEIRVPRALRCAPDHGASDVVWSRTALVSMRDQTCSMRPSRKR